MLNFSLFSMIITMIMGDFRESYRYFVPVLIGIVSLYRHRWMQLVKLTSWCDTLRQLLLRRKKMAVASIHDRLLDHSRGKAKRSHGCRTVLYLSYERSNTFKSNDSLLRRKKREKKDPIKRPSTSYGTALVNKTRCILWDLCKLILRRAATIEKATKRNHDGSSQ